MAPREEREGESDGGLLSPKWLVGGGELSDSSGYSMATCLLPLGRDC